MRYRVVRDIGSADYAVGAAIEGEALGPRRLRLLVEQRRLEPITPLPSALAAEQAQRIADLEAQVADLTARNAAPEADAPDDLSKLTVEALKALASARGIAFPADSRKAELVAALEAAQEGAQDA